MPGCELGPSWWEAGALNTAFPLLPISITIKTMLILNYKKTAHYYKFCNNELFFVVDCLPEVLLASVLHPHPIRWMR